MEFFLSLVPWFVILGVFAFFYNKKQSSSSESDLKKEQENFDGIFIFRCNNERHKYRTVKLYEDKIEVTSDAGNRTIYLDQLTSIDISPVKNIATPGYIRFLSGSTDKNYNDWRDARDDGSALILSDKKDNEDALKLKNIIEKTKREMNNSQAQTNTQNSIAEQLREFKQLLEDDIITEKEFQEKKEKLLNE